ncbi:hypothetical protein MNQ98_23240 [Paenibacillus sp. N3/727]|uniref:hypothetical protein n=1 Tax=Paenibacillus sp. N3/727 TaxID=2925845 RepID=UPI001F53455A|nr:hypothetical protein [Paenibacillus sp. N3/727]UNK17362.1 hypothetical protein MNQ98_23240 [Paenibacillus sp. N3/727]
MIIARSRSINIILGLFVIVLLLGGYQSIANKTSTKNSSNEEKIIDQAKATTIKHLIDKYKLDVEITGEKILPSYKADEIILEGNVIGSEEHAFTISVNYEKNEVFYFGMSPELVTTIRAKVYEPFVEKNKY